MLAICIALLAAQTANNLYLRGTAEEDRRQEQAAAEMQQRLSDFTEMLRAQTTYQALDWNMAVAALKGDRTWHKDATRALATADTALKQRMSTLQGIDGPVIETIQDQMNRASRHAIATVEAMTERDIEAADLSAKIYRDSLQEADVLLNNILAQEQAALKAFHQDELRRSALTLNLHTVLTTLSFLLGLALVVVVYRSFVSPLGRSVLAIRQIHSGRGRLALPPPSDDEFGEMATVLHRFVSQTEQLRTLAYTDDLTGLASRGKLMATLEVTLDAAQRHRTAAAVLYVDLDHFRALNESLGNLAGDRFLVEAAGRLRPILPAEALISRYSGDEFIAVIPELPDDAALTERLREMSERILRAVAAPFVVGEQRLNVTASIGIAVAPRDGSTGDELISSAAAAVHLAKRSGRNNAQFARAQLTEDARRHITLAADIHRGLEAGEFVPFYQPIVNIGTGLTVGAEALVRWRHATRGIVPPGEFIRFAEDAGLIAALGNSLLDKACAFGRDLKRRGRPMAVSVNLSARQLESESIVADIHDRCSQYGLAPGDISFEITESAMMTRPDRSARVLSAIKSLGYRLSIDDFGTGYSSLAYLERFPIDRIKIDRSFVAKVEASRETQAIVSATLTLARSLGLDVVAEGVETPGQMHRLAELGCPLQQGYLFSAALPPEEMEAWLGRKQLPVRIGRAAAVG